MATGVSPPQLDEKRVQEILLADEHLRVLAWGEFGVGKTTFALTAPKPFVLDSNDGLISVAVKNPSGSIGQRFTPVDHTDLEALGYWMAKHGADHDTYVIDTGDSLVSLLLGEIVDDSVRRRQKKNDKDVSLRMSYVPEQGDHYGNQRQMKAFLSFLTTLKKHVVVTAARRAPDPEHGRWKWGPDFSPGMTKVFVDWADVVGELVYLEGGEYAGHRALRIGLSKDRISKNRFEGLLDPDIIDPTFADLWGPIAKLIAGNKKAK